MTKINQPTITEDTEIPTKPGKIRKPRTKKTPDYETVKDMALSLSLSDQANLCKVLKGSVSEKLAIIQSQAKEAETLASGL